MSNDDRTTTTLSEDDLFHDPLCPAEWKITHRPRFCYCSLIAKVRSDERKRWAVYVDMHEGEVAALNAELAHAESVAARLVEVIAEMSR